MKSSLNLSNTKKKLNKISNKIIDNAINMMKNGQQLTCA